MWAHWQDASEVVAVVTSTGAQLSNGDLEGLHRLRDLERRHSPKAEEVKPAKDERLETSPDTHGRGTFLERGRSL